MAHGMCIDVAGGSSVAGANVLIWGANNGNNQKFYIAIEAANKYSIRCLKSGMYIDVEGAVAGDGKNVCQWPDNDQNNQRWRIVETGETVTINGTSCKVVTISSWADGGGTAYKIDVDHALTTNWANVLIWSTNGGDNQKFVLLPTISTDDKMPVPSDISWAPSAGSYDYAEVLPSANKLYLTWLCTQSWASTTTNGYRMRYQSRLMSAATGQWGAWSAVSAWSVLTVQQVGERAWDMTGIPATFDTNTYKAMEVQVEIASQAGLSPAYVASRPAVKSLLSVAKPSISLGSATFSPAGLTLGYSATYPGGRANIYVTSVRVGTTEYLRETFAAKGLDATGTITIPMGHLSSWIFDNSTVSVTHHVGSDLLPEMAGDYTTSLTSSYDSGSDVTGVSVDVVDGRLMRLRRPGGMQSAWVIVGDQAIEGWIDSNGYAYMPYPFGRSFEVFACTATYQGSWGVLHLDAATTAGYVSGEPCHAWNWDGGSFVLEHQVTDPPSVGRTVEGSYELYDLGSRPWQAAIFAPTLHGAWTAAGVLVPGTSEGTVEQLEALAKQHFATYRAPNGSIAKVAITGISYTDYSDRTEVTVSMVEVT